MLRNSYEVKSYIFHLIPPYLYDLIGGSSSRVPNLGLTRSARIIVLDLPCWFLSLLIGFVWSSHVMTCSGFVKCQIYCMIFSAPNESMRLHHLRYKLLSDIRVYLFIYLLQFPHLKWPFLFLLKKALFKM